MSDTIFIKEIEVTDPDTGNDIPVEIHKDKETGAMFGVDSSYAELEEGRVKTPFSSKKVELSEASGDDLTWTREDERAAFWQGWAITFNKDDLLQPPMDFIMEVEDLHGSEGNYSGYERLSDFLIVSGEQDNKLAAKAVKIVRNKISELSPEDRDELFSHYGEGSKLQKLLDVNIHENRMSPSPSR